MNIKKAESKNDTADTKKAPFVSYGFREFVKKKMTKTARPWCHLCHPSDFLFYISKRSSDFL